MEDNDKQSAIYPLKILCFSKDIWELIKLQLLAHPTEITYNFR